jgi:hypothetical protein
MTSKMPNSPELLASLLKVLAGHPQGLATRQIDQAVVQDIGISSDIASQIRSGNRTEIQYRLAWCRTKAKKAGLIERSTDGTWKLA